jgi:hypothetical protein
MSVLPGIFKEKPKPEQQQPDQYEVAMSHAHSAGGNFVGLNQKIWNERMRRAETRPHGFYYSLYPVKENTTFIYIPTHFEQLPNPCSPEDVEAAKKRILARLKK